MGRIGGLLERLWPALNLPHAAVPSASTAFCMACQGVAHSGCLCRDMGPTGNRAAKEPIRLSNTRNLNLADRTISLKDRHLTFIVELLPKAGNSAHQEVRICQPERHAHQGALQVGPGALFSYVLGKLAIAPAHNSFRTFQKFDEFLDGMPVDGDGCCTAFADTRAATIEHSIQRRLPEFGLDPS